MERYQDYVIKDGKYIGKIEEMYQKFSNPWHQLEDADNSYSRLDTVLSLKKLGAASVLEIGCGLGAFTQYLALNLPNVTIVGMDISDTAIKKARERYPKIEFMVGDLCEIDKVICEIKENYSFDVIILSEIMWFILKDLKKIIEKLQAEFRGKHIIINQTFYKGGQKYGNEYFTNLQEMIKYLNMEPLYYTTAVSSENEISYETHSVFKL